MEKRFLKYFLIILFPLIFSSCNALEPGLSILVGNYSYQIGEFQQSTINYLNGLETGRYTEWIYYNMGNVYFSLGEGGAAIDVWANVESAEDPELRFRLNFNKGVLFYQLGKYNESYLFFKEALKANPSSLDAKINLELTLGKLAAPAVENSTGSGEQVNSINPADTERMLEYIKRKEGELWFSTEKETDINLRDW
ncbi:MAG: tetratricopeptide repeat protein [Spirochaetaceae bacterium]|jgi:tetratricopeptide (TPR) repeat protein|nr:tetratricopeptide repeat protein [Spirochaetaceae bacterium]